MIFHVRSIVFFVYFHKVPDVLFSLLGSLNHCHCLELTGHLDITVNSTVPDAYSEPVNIAYILRYKCFACVIQKEYSCLERYIFLGHTCGNSSVWRILQSVSLCLFLFHEILFIIATAIRTILVRGRFALLSCGLGLSGLLESFK